MNKTFFASIVSLLILTAIFGAGPVLAQVSTQNPGSVGTQNPGTVGTQNSPKIGIKIDNPFKCGGQSNCTLYTFMMVIVDELIMPIGGILCVLAFIWAGFKYVMAQGNTTKIQEAHRTLLYAALGTALLLGAKVFATVISNTVDKLKV